MRELVELGLILLGIIVLALILILGIYVPLTYLDCNGYERGTGKPTKVVALTCYINDTGGWYSWEEYKNRLITRGTM